MLDFKWPTLMLIQWINRRFLFLGIAFFALPFFFYGCNKFLDVKPVGMVIPETEEQFRATLVNAYSRFPRDLGKLEMRTDIARLNELDQHNVETYQYLYMWQDTEIPDVATTCLWKDYYYAIYISNYVIEQLGSAPSSEEYSQLVGEAYLLRAYAHFLLVNIYAPQCSAVTLSEPGVPLALTPETDKELPRSNVGEVYAQVKRDVEEGLKYLTVERWEKPEFKYRFSKHAAWAFQCRLALYMGEWDNVIAAGEKLLRAGYELVDLLASTSVKPCFYQSTESILALDYPMDDAMLNVLRPSEELLALYNQSDDRRFRTTYREPKVGTYVVDRGKEGESYAFRCTFRLGEVYLNMCEAYTQRGDLDMARNLLLLLQEKRLREPYRAEQRAHVETLSAAAMMEYLLAERARELAFEGQRWFDLRRGGQPEIRHELGGKTYLLQAGDIRYTLPIPREARENNSSL